jgi:MFS family permease
MTTTVVAAGLFAPTLRPVSIGMLALISIMAFEHLAVATVMPLVAQALDGLPLYPAAFGVALAASILGMALAGRWSDRAGPPAPLWAGVAIFVLGVIVVGAAPAMLVLVFGRALQGFGGGLMIVALYALVGRCYPPQLHPRIFAAFAGAWVVPILIGPTLAALIAEHLGWRWVFLLAAVLAAPAALLLRQGLRRLSAPAPATATTTEAAPHELWLAAGAAVAAGLLFAGSPSAAGGGAPLLLGLALLGVAIFAPRLLPAGTFTGGSGLPAVVALRGLAAAAFLCGEVLLPLLLVQERGFTTLQAGLVLTAGALGWTAGSWLQAGRRSQGAARRRMLQAGMGGLMLGGLTVALTIWPAVPAWIALPGWIVAGLGIGVVYPMLGTLTLECAAPGAQGQASSALQLADALFSAVALAVAGLLPAFFGGPARAAPYLMGFAVVVLLALLGVLLAPRARPIG